MDAEAEVQIFNHFRTVTQNQMVLLISHRFSTVRMADQIMVLQAGEILEQGTHDELLQAGDATLDSSRSKQRDINSRAVYT
jgi:ABC-type multidrug transport system fused ATPase/permease subunit